MALSFLKTIEKPDDLRKIECLLNHITANKNYVKRIPLKHKGGKTKCVNMIML